MINKILGCKSPSQISFQSGTRTITQDFSEEEERKKLERIASKVKKDEFKYSNSDEYKDAFVSKTEPTTTIKVYKNVGNIGYERIEGRRKDLMIFTPTQTSPPVHQELLNLLKAKKEQG